MASEIQISPVGGEPRLAREQRFTKDRVTLGRLADNDVSLPGKDGGVLSRRHAELFVGDEGILYVKDLGSRAGTWVNGLKIKASVKVRPKDVIALGEEGPSFRVRLEVDGKEVSFATPDDHGPGKPGTAVPGPARTPSDRGVPTPRPSPAPAHAVTPLPAPAPHVEPPIRQSQFVNLVSEVMARERSKTLYLLGVLAAGGLAGALLLVTWSRGERSRQDEQLQRLASTLAEDKEEIARLRAEIAARDRKLDELREKEGLSEAERATLVADTEQKLATLRTALKRNEEAVERAAATSATPAEGQAASGQPAWSDLVERYKESIFLCVNVDRTKSERGFGTAFAIAPDVLATNAHVIELLNQAPEHFVIQNQTGRIWKVKELIASSAYKGVKSPDVGLIRLDTRGQRLTPLPLASDEDLRRLKTGTQLGTLGFPGELASSYFATYDRTAHTYRGVVATFKDGWIGRITDYQDQSADFERSTYIQHSASLTGGTSGSPMFTSDGKVVALNNASWDQQVVVQTPGSKRSVVRAKSAAEISFAIRVDELRHLWEDTKW